MVYHSATCLEVAFILFLLRAFKRLMLLPWHAWLVDTGHLLN